MKKIIIILAVLILFTSCNTSKNIFFIGANSENSIFASGYQRYQKEFYDVFDTFTVVVGYAKSEDELAGYADKIYVEMLRLHRLFDIYNNYDGINNLKTINDSAGVSRVKVDNSIIELLVEAKIAFAESDGAVNVAMGSILKIWHDYRERANDDPNEAQIPPMEELESDAKNTNINDLIIDEAASTVFIKNPEVSLDVGALAKGFAVEKAMQIAKQAGFKSGFISAGGNVSVVGKPLDGRDGWNVGVQSPKFMPDGSQMVYETLLVRDKAIVSSGNYQRFYVVDGKSYHHIIDPKTLMPAARFAAVTIIHSDSGIADMLSTSLFILPYEQGLALLQKYNADAIWIFDDDTSLSTDGYKALLRQHSEQNN